ncbi:response regulator transcription factor [Acetobacter sp. TBRC 12305]|uniref:Response regulator transcription factor n=1 Tax=Acetobacter garciniae TaxID=2817435 RepID=A0A939KLL1_9PROT|nr:response regulator transcription factor [Acetobacter garciniae]MBO1324368.1 response regulator transcription factor [Acetobacter garciniae]MBX0344057.1 response regulator transcription factor [Acetobacter garciniae]
MRILFVENKFASSRTILSALKKAGLASDLARSGQNAIELLRNYDYGLAIINLRLTDMDGFTFLNSLRALKISTPVIILSATDAPDAKIRAFSMGADDFLVEPIDMDELVARVQAILRRSNGFAHPVIQVGALVLDLNSQSVCVQGQPVHLTGKEFAILELLVLRKGIAQTKETFLNHLYGGRDEPDIKIIDVFICKLRKKLQFVGGDSLISTVWGKGYILHDPQARKPAAMPHMAHVGTVEHARAPEHLATRHLQLLENTR